MQSQVSYEQVLGLLKALQTEEVTKAE